MALGRLFSLDATRETVIVGDVTTYQKGAEDKKKPGIRKGAELV
jgi:hypothetical protein